MRDKYYYWRGFSKREVENGGPSIGVDFGGVIIDENRSARRIDTNPNAIYGKEICMDGALEGIKMLVELTDGRVWVISKAKTLRRKRTLDWLNKVDFYSNTGLKRENVIFCDNREDKIKICRDLNINYFVDNQLHVIQLLQERVPYIFLFGDRERKTYETFASLVTPVIDWDDCIKAVIDAISEMRKIIGNIK